MNARTAAPVVTEMHVIPVAGHDSMLLNLSGAHGPFFTRNVVILKDSAGHTGVGEVPGRRKIRADARGSAAARRRPIDRRATTPFSTRSASASPTATPAAAACRPSTCARRSTRSRRSSRALLDLLGQFLGVPVAALLGEGSSATRSRCSAICSYVGDRTQDGPDVSQRARRGRRLVAAAPRGGADARGDRAPRRGGARALRIQRLQAEGRRARAATQRWRRSPRWPSAFRARASRSTRTARGRSTEAIALCRDKHGVLAYAEDPCGAESGFSGREVMAEFRRATGLPTATNMVATDWRQLAHALRLQAVDIPLADPHFWTMQGSVRVAQLCRDCAASPGARTRTTTSTSRSRCSRTSRAAAPGQDHRDRHALDLAGRPAPDEGAAADRQAARSPCRRRPGLGIEIDMAEIEKAHALYQEHGLGARDDAAAMQFLIPGWTFDNKRPCLVR